MKGAIPSVLGMMYALSELVLSLLKRADRGESRVSDRGSLRLLWIVIMASVACAFSAAFQWPTLGMDRLAAPARALGVVVFAAGLIIRWRAIIYLGRFFTVNVAIRSDHRLIDDGPYRHVRHPSYTGAVMAFVGLGLCMGNWASLLLLTVPILAVFLWRMRVEEAALLQGLGAAYESYMRRTRRLIPFVY
jgi:protein-S-isoprenylcysteine O-methyltransferase Ste14